MRRHPAGSRGSSLKTAVLFIAIVAVVIFVALGIHFVSTVNKSVFDGKHQFVLLIKAPNQQGMLAIFTPTSNRLGVLPLQMKTNENIAFDLHTGIDGTVSLGSSLPDDYNIQKILLQAMFTKNSSASTVTWYDLLRLYLIAKTSSVATAPLDRLPHDSVSTTMFFTLFQDVDIQKENQTIQVINSTDQSGLGSRLEMELTSMGCNVIDVRSAPTEAPVSQITYDTMSYTVSRLQRVLHISARPESQQGIADIQITIGKDDEQPRSF